MLEDDEREKDLADEYMAQLPFRYIAHPRVFLIFSGIPGCGKTVLARKLASDLKAQYIQHDEIRRAVTLRGIDLETVHIPSVSKLIINDVVANDNNKFIILDGSIDRSWKRYYEHVEELQATPVVIRLDVPIDIIRTSLVERDGKESGILPDLARYQAEYNECCRRVHADLTVNESYDYSTVLDFVRRKLASAL